MSDAEAQVGIDVNVMGGVEGQFQQSVKDHIRELQRVRDEIDKLTDQLKDSANHMKGGVAGGSQGRVYTGGMQSFQYEVMNRIKHLAYSSFGSGGANNFVREVLSVAAGIAISELFQTFRKTLFSKQLPALRSFPSVAATATAANVAKTYGRIPLPTLLNTSLPIVPGNQPYSVHPPVSPASMPFKNYLKRKLEQENYLKQGGPVPTSYFGKLRAIIQAKLKERDSGALKKEEADQIAKETLELMSGLSGYATEIGALASFVDPEKIPKLLEGLVGKTGKPLGKDPMTRLRAAFARYAKEVLTTKPKHEAEHPTSIPMSTPATEEKITPVETKEKPPEEPEQNPKKRGGFIINPAAVIRDISIAAMHGMRHGIGAGITSIAGLGARAGSFVGKGALGLPGIALGAGSLTATLAFSVYEGMRRWSKEAALQGPTQSGMLSHTQSMYGLTNSIAGIPYTLATGRAELNTRSMRMTAAEDISRGYFTNVLAGFEQGRIETFTEIEQGIRRWMAGSRLNNIEQRENARETGRSLVRTIGLSPLHLGGMLNMAAELWRGETPSQLGPLSNRPWTLPGIGTLRPNQFDPDRVNFNPENPQNLPGLPGYITPEQRWQEDVTRQERRYRERLNEALKLQELISFPNWQPQILTASQYRMGLQAEAMRAPGDQARFQAAVEENQRVLTEIKNMIEQAVANVEGARNPIRGWFE